MPAPPDPTYSPSPRSVKVLTQTLYVGCSLLPVIDAADPAAFTSAVEEVYATVVATDFPSRARALAALLAAERPDVVGLQEVARWTVDAPAAGREPAWPSFDFLQTLRTQTTRCGLRYEVAAVGHNADIAGVPLGEDVLRLQNRDVILVRADSPQMRWAAPRTGRYRSQQVLTIAGGAAMSFDRGWASVDLDVAGRGLRFVNTHLEVEQYAEVQQQQTDELLAGPLTGSGPVVAVGDFNSAADGSTTTSYRRLLSAGLTDAWTARSEDPGYTCCQEPDLGNAGSTLMSRIDYVLARGDVEVVECHRVADQPYQHNAPRWPSDHAGVAATLRLR